MTTPSVSLVCKTCGERARRKLTDEPGSRGVHETPCEPAKCPKGHGYMVRVDGGTVEDPSASVHGYLPPHDLASFEARQRERRAPCRPCTYKRGRHTVTVWDD